MRKPVISRIITRSLQRRGSTKYSMPQLATAAVVLMMFLFSNAHCSFFDTYCCRLWRYLRPPNLPSFLSLLSFLACYIQVPHKDPRSERLDDNLSARREPPLPAPACAAVGPIGRMPVSGLGAVAGDVLVQICSYVDIKDIVR